VIVMSLFKGLIEVPDLRTMKQIAEEVAVTHKITMGEMMSQARCFRASHPRQEAMWLMRQTGRYSYPQIGRFFGKDHTTVLHAERQYEKRLAEKKAA
jgi:chromosomal replication initiator protein